MAEFSEMVTSLIEMHEGVRLKPYRCTAGRLTIGVGRNLDDVGISEGEAHMLLANDIAKVQRQLMTLDWFNTLDEVRQAVLIDMAFNLGFAGLMTFKSMLGAVRVGDWKEAARQMVKSKWADQVGSRALRLAQMMVSGKWWTAPV